MAHTENKMEKSMEAGLGRGVFMQNAMPHPLMSVPVTTGAATALSVPTAPLS